MMVALFAATTFGDARYFFTDLRSIFSARAIVLPAGDNRKVVKGLLDFSEGSDDGHFESVSALKSLLHIKNYRLRLSNWKASTMQIAEALSDLIKTRAVAVRISGQHLCMMMRGESL
jgi:hypothetical protein